MRLPQPAAPSPRVLLAAAGAALALGTALGPVTAAAATTPPPVAGTSPVVPATPATLPAGMEALAAYVPAVSCDSTDKPGSTSLGALLTTTYPGTTYAGSRACGSDAMSTTEHYDGRAVDWFTNVRTAEGRARGEALVNWLTATDARGNVAANARRLGVMYIIWNNRIWGAYRPADGWRPYSGCASTPAASSDTTCHRNHVHLSLSWAGAMRRTSWWTGTVAGPDYGPCRLPDLNWAPAYTTANPRPCPSYPRVSPAPGASALNRTLVAYSGMTLRRGSSGPAVTAVQTAVGATAAGSFGDTTVTAVAAFQVAHALAGDGVVGPQTWRALLKATAPAPAPTPAPAPGGRYAAYEKVTLKPGDRNATVKVLQKALAGPVVDGDFGPRTKAAVIALQTRHHLTANGIVTAVVWRALG